MARPTWQRCSAFSVDDFGRTADRTQDPGQPLFGQSAAAFNGIMNFDATFRIEQESSARRRASPDRTSSANLGSRSRPFKLMRSRGRTDRVIGRAIHWLNAKGE